MSNMVKLVVERAGQFLLIWVFAMIGITMLAVFPTVLVTAAFYGDFSADGGDVPWRVTAWIALVGGAVLSALYIAGDVKK
jgi:hypothetical protein